MSPLSRRLLALTASAVGSLTFVTAVPSIVSAVAAAPPDKSHRSEYHKCPWAFSHPGSITEDQADYAVYCLMRLERRHKSSLKFLRSSEPLSTAAREHATAAVSIKWWVPGADPHTNPQTGSTIESRIWASYLKHCHRRFYYSENAYWGSGDGNTPAAAVAWWMNSDAQRASILSEDAKYAGVAVVRGAPVPNFTGPEADTYVVDFAKCG